MRELYPPSVCLYQSQKQLAENYLSGFLSSAMALLTYITYGNVSIHLEQIVCYVYTSSNTNPH